jgi:hypothetical protein
VVVIVNFFNGLQAKVVEGEEAVDVVEMLAVEQLQIRRGCFSA